MIATNVAESSLTVPGVRCVIDCGTARVSRYAARSKVERLPIEPVSQASADESQYQREGIYDAALARYRWLIEEFRVSLFAQQLGTLTSVSAQRLDRLWAEIEDY